MEELSLAVLARFWPATVEMGACAEQRKIADIRIIGVAADICGCRFVTARSAQRFMEMGREGPLRDLSIAGKGSLPRRVLHSTAGKAQYLGLITDLEH
jgi:hypothetical protein